MVVGGVGACVCGACVAGGGTDLTFGGALALQAVFCP